MPTLKDYQCNECSELMEEFEQPNKCSTCGSGNVTRVFTPNCVQFIVDKASTVEYVHEENKKIMDKVYEEDSEQGSDFQKMIESAPKVEVEDHGHDDNDCEYCGYR